jgi:hypothetical protein
MGEYSPRAQLCEVIIDSTYKGIYLFSEKIKRDKNRVDIAKLEPDDNAGDKLPAVISCNRIIGIPALVSNPTTPRSIIRDLMFTLFMNIPSQKISRNCRKNISHLILTAWRMHCIALILQILKSVIGNIWMWNPSLIISW